MIHLSYRNQPINNRQARIIQTVPPPNFFGPQQLQQQQPQYHKYIPTSEAYLTRRIGEAVELDPSLRRSPDGKIPSNFQQERLKLQIQQRQQYQFNSPREVSETDLYLLGAIEKLVYRVDYMEKRLRRTEQLVYYLMEGNKQKIESDPCPKNFTKINQDCYFFGIKERLDWKSANQECKTRNSTLAEFEKIEKFQDVIGSILSHQEQRGHDFWLGGINPGLLFIWTTSAKPVNPNANLTLLTSSNKTSESSSTTKIPAKVLNNATKKNETLTTNFPEILGNGRCLRLSYNPSTFSYGYTGQDCSSKQHFMCVIHDKSLDNEIKRIAKELKFIEE